MHEALYESMFMSECTRNHIILALRLKQMYCSRKKLSIKTVKNVYYANCLSNSYTMGCPPVRGDNPRALASGLSYVQVDNPLYNYLIPPISV